MFVYVLVVVAVVVFNFAVKSLFPFFLDALWIAAQ